MVSSGELVEQSEIFDAVILDPPYVLKPEDYGCSDWDIGKRDGCLL